MIKMMKKEYDVLDIKLNNPNKKVLCPRCGEE